MTSAFIIDLQLELKPDYEQLNNVLLEMLLNTTTGALPAGPAAVRVGACDLLLGGQQRISGRRGGRRSWVGRAKVGGEDSFWEVGSSGFPKMEG